MEITRRSHGQRGNIHEQHGGKKPPNLYLILPSTISAPRMLAVCEMIRAVGLSNWAKMASLLPRVSSNPDRWLTVPGLEATVSSLTSQWLNIQPGPRLAPDEIPPTDGCGKTCGQDRPKKQKLSLGRSDPR
ncbi:hypothetical protein RRG08_048554 [Elysia crispata]|uniref:Uncharacterized protein n=1 Tax=Elysia crispata TaxID=231223 RepID=A0AAE1EA01_9GAST|nr:hypothetical protein RRG08_048554 [Elysia crispata]